MPSHYRGQSSSSGDPILYHQHRISEFQRETIEAVSALNAHRYETTGDRRSPRIAPYELAFRMQTAAPT
jgi:hypothetical protein